MKTKSAPSVRGDLRARPVRTCTTPACKANLTRAIPFGTAVEAGARVDHAGRRTVVASATLTGVADGKVYVTGSTTCVLLAP